MRTASASKLVTGVAAMQCVERSLIGLDDDVLAFVPELRDIQLLTGYDQDDKPMLVKPKEKITLRFVHFHSLRSQEILLSTKYNRIEDRAYSLTSF